ncbi:pyroglutamyl-peptidase I [Agrilutibacter solisilvae]|uniref:Pyrrolidone-carboxylate peptidase n=1 Tax=Agrilutibacter solisilvae TaxID=2763317 RepID=A0A975ART3_9GAMM|nr:pyroglutamyl-peptidase I [Lysobacter solisilvae]QSX77349.1 pyroglutamyl-peptidase I [Lysobacter solisilvae]
MPSPAPPNVLLTGFAPFGGETVNPSWQAVSAIEGELIAGHRVHTRCLPVAFGAALDDLRTAIRTLRPALVLCVGEAGGRAAMSLERVAINVDDARIPDNAGARPVDQPVVAHSPAAYFTDLPIKAMLAALQAARIPAEVSQTAGTFVCNHVFYGLMHALRRRAARGGFIHIPYSPEQAARHPGAPSLDVATVQAGLRLALQVALTTSTDARLSAGAEH